MLLETAQGESQIQFKLVLVGDDGKMTFVKHHLVNWRIMTIQSNVWNTIGQEKFGGPRDYYYDVPNWHRDLVRVYENIPITLCDNKVGTKDRNVKAKSIIFHRKKNLQ
ncbi:unnamed protein product [Nyctereutes procyonoides]|uniref:(raccoon dog) hypothetical protein n=1 Tax=Nyctereutes procyonoides TaxID=34880 RepID=A0A811YZU3_NYCPR|nr:unnamed protein product [Nyctereutes procyonoides]